MKEEIGVDPLAVWGSLSRPVISLNLDNVYGCVGYIGHFEDTPFTLSQKEVFHCSCVVNCFVLLLLLRCNLLLCYIYVDILLFVVK